jgi:hypothetical protein
LFLNKKNSKNTLNPTMVHNRHVLGTFKDLKKNSKTLKIQLWTTIQHGKIGNLVLELLAKIQFRRVKPACLRHAPHHLVLRRSACSVGWWLMAGAGLF